MKARISCAAVIILAGVVLLGCETYKPFTSPGVPLPQLKRVAIMVVPGSKEKQKRANDIANVLAKREIDSVMVPAGDPVPKDVDGYFTYTDNWQWDLTMYLAELEIELHEPQTARLIASAKYKQSWLHRYPTPIDIADNLVGQILGEAPKASGHPQATDSK